MVSLALGLTPSHQQDHQVAEAVTMYHDRWPDGQTVALLQRAQLEGKFVVLFRLA